MKQANLVKHRKSAPKHLLAVLPSLLPAVRILEAKLAEGNGVDLTVSVATPQGHRRTLLIDIEPSPAAGRVRESIRGLKDASAGRRGGYPVLASRFLGPRARAICREEGVGYLDLAGNCLLRFDDLYVEKVVEANPFKQSGRPSSLFTPIASRIIRVLLEQPKQTWLVKPLAQRAAVSLGHVSNVTRRLIDDEYAVRAAGGVQLTQPGRLLDEWRDRQSAMTAQAHAYYSFEADVERRWRRIADAGHAQSLRYAATGLAAASRLAPFVHGVQVVEWYVEDAASVARWAQALDLRPAESGPNVILRVPAEAGVWSGSREVDGLTCVSDVQLYLDLWNDPARGREQADFLRSQRFGW